MRVLRRMLTLALAVAFGMIAYPIAAQGQKQIKQAKKLLEKIKLVDGTGSGLDADTLRGSGAGASLSAGSSRWRQWWSCCPRHQRCFRGSGDRPWRVRSHDCAAAWC